MLVFEEIKGKVLRAKYVPITGTGKGIVMAHNNRYSLARHEDHC